MKKPKAINRAVTTDALIFEEQLRQLALKTHRSLIQTLTHPLYLRPKDTLTKDQLFEALLEAVQEANQEQGVKP